MTWAEFRKRYEAEKLASLGEKTQQTAATAMNHLERVTNPDRLCKLTTATLSRFQAELRKPYEVVRGDKRILKAGMKDVTIASILRHLRPALSWGRVYGHVAAGARPAPAQTAQGPSADARPADHR